MNYIKRIACNFKRLREIKNWTQLECAERGEVDTSYIGQVESASIKSFGTQALLKWAGIFKVDIIEILRNPGPSPHKTREEEEILEALKKEGIETVADINFILKQWRLLKETEGDAFIEAIRMVAKTIEKKRKRKP